MADEPWEAQRKIKYEHHDLALEDIDRFDLVNMKSMAIRDFVRTVECDAAVLTISAFMGYLTQKGYRIVKEKK